MELGFSATLTGSLSVSFALRLRFLFARGFGLWTKQDTGNGLSCVRLFITRGVFQPLLLELRVSVVSSGFCCLVGFVVLFIQLPVTACCGRGCALSLYLLLCCSQSVLILFLFASFIDAFFAITYARLAQLCGIVKQFSSFMWNNFHIKSIFYS